MVTRTRDAQDQPGPPCECLGSQPLGEAGATELLSLSVRSAMVLRQTWGPAGCAQLFLAFIFHLDKKESVYVLFTLFQEK